MHREKKKERGRGREREKELLIKWVNEQLYYLFNNNFHKFSASMILHISNLTEKYEKYI